MDNREIDKLVAEKVLNWEWRERKYNRKAFGDYPPAYHVWWDKAIDNVPPLCLTEKTNYNTNYTPPFSTDILAAWEVLKNIANAWSEVSIGQSRWTVNVGYFECVIEKPTGDRVVIEAETGPLAICLAALRAVGVEVTP